MPYNTMQKVGAAVVIFDQTALANLASTAGVISAEIDNTSAAFTHATFELVIDFATAPTGPVELYAIVAFDGTNYADYQTTAAAFGAPGSRIAAFSPRGVNTVQRMVLRDVPIPTCGKFKLLLINKGNFNLDGTAMSLTAQYKRQVVVA